MKQVNQEIKAYLQVFVSHHQDDWADWLPLAEFAYNNCIHSATHCTPFKLDSGQHPWMGLEPTQSSTVEAADDFAQRMSQMQDEAKALSSMLWMRWHSTMITREALHPPMKLELRFG